MYVYIPSLSVARLSRTADSPTRRRCKGKKCSLETVLGQEAVVFSSFPSISPRISSGYHYEFAAFVRNIV